MDRSRTSVYSCTPVICPVSKRFTHLNLSTSHANKKDCRTTGRHSFVWPYSNHEFNLVLARGIKKLLLGTVPEYGRNMSDPRTETTVKNVLEEEKDGALSDRPPPNRRGGTRHAL